MLWSIGLRVRGSGDLLDGTVVRFDTCGDLVEDVEQRT